MPDLVAQMTEEGPVRLGEILAHPLARGIVGVDGDHPVSMPGEDILLGPRPGRGVGEGVERKPAERILDAVRDRQTQPQSP
jgi:hypothetical protein